MLCHLTHGTSDNCRPWVRLSSPGEWFVGWAQAERNRAGGRFGSPSAFLGMAGVWLGCTGFLVSLLLCVLGWALGPAAGPGVALWEGRCLHLEPGRHPPNQHKCKNLVLEDGETSFRLEMVNGTALPEPKLRVCWRQVGGDGLTQAVVRHEHPAQRLVSCGCCSDMFYGPVSSYSWSCPAPPLPE